MPPLPPVPAVTRVFIEGFVDNDDTYRWGNVLFFDYIGGPPSPTDLTTYASNVAATWATRMAPQCPSPTHLTNVTVTDLTSPTSSEGLWGGDNTGSRGDDSIPANAAMLMSYAVGGLRYRGGHPRSYLYVGGNADFEGAAHWKSTFVTAVQVAWRQFLDTTASDLQGTTTWQHHVGVSYKSGGVHRITPVKLELGPAVGALEMASQRRRIGRRKHRR